MTLADMFQLILGGPLSTETIRFKAFDGSARGPDDAPVTFEIVDDRTLRYLAAAPGQLGIARAYVSGSLKVEGNMYDALAALSDIRLNHLPPRDLARIGAALAKYRLKPLAPPPQENPSRARTLQHTLSRDAQVIKHHYDVSNVFYRWLLGPSMAYTCAVFPQEDATLEQAQAEKFDLVCRKLDLKPGMRLLDVGCGWGGMVLHAVKHYGVQAVGVTLSQQQARWGQQAIREAGLEERATIRHQDYRQVPETGFDAISSIGLTEHIGKAKYPEYFTTLYRKLLPGGRLLNHSITRAHDAGKTQYRNGFINRYVFPDGELTGPGHLVQVFTQVGLELRHSENFREHYARTLQAWCENLDEHWEQSVAEIGEGTALVWRLYLAASRIGFEKNWIQLHQFLTVRPESSGAAHLPLRLQF